MSDDAQLTARFTASLTPEELAALDDWRFARRIGSRSHAARKLLLFALANWRDEEGADEGAGQVG